MAWSTARGRSRFAILVSLLTLLLMGVVSTSSAAGTGSVIARVQYPLGTRYLPLPGVEVFLWDGAAPHFGCTNANGVVVFENLPAGGGYIAATGASGSNCANGEFREPGTNLKMYAVFYNNHHGERDFDPFALAAGQTREILFRTVRPPANQNLVCGGLKATIVGTAAGEVLVGTPEDDVISGGGGRDTIKGLGGDDSLCGGGGRDRLVGGTGNDMLFGEGGNESGGNRGLFGGPGNDVAYGGAGDDTCVAETARDCEPGG